MVNYYWWVQGSNKTPGNRICSIYMWWGIHLSDSVNFYCRVTIPFVWQTFWFGSKSAGASNNINDDCSLLKCRIRLRQWATMPRPWAKKSALCWGDQERDRPDGPEYHVRSSWSMQTTVTGASCSAHPGSLMHELQTWDWTHKCFRHITLYHSNRSDVFLVFVWPMTCRHLLEVDQPTCQFSQNKFYECRLNIEINVGDRSLQLQWDVTETL